MKKLLSTTCAIALALSFSAPPASAVAVLDYLGYGYETGGLPPSVAGDELVVVAVATDAAASLGLDLTTTEVTFHAHSLVSVGSSTDAFGNTVIDYSGGILDMYVDSAMNADWGVFPPNATAPSTFSDGGLLFRGAFRDFRLVLTPFGSGAFEGHLDGIAGLLIGALCNDCGYTWGGAFGTAAGAQIPDGYDLQIDGVFELDMTVGTEQTAIGQIKAMYR